MGVLSTEPRALASGLLPGAAFIHFQWVMPVKIFSWGK